jgi:hypothetical protein
MEHYAGIDVSLELSSVCVVDARGKFVRETKVASEPEALVAFFASLDFAVKRIGLEAGPLSAWLRARLKRAGFDAVKAIVSWPRFQGQRAIILRSRLPRQKDLRPVRDWQRMIGSIAGLRHDHGFRPVAAIVLGDHHRDR